MDEEGDGVAGEGGFEVGVGIAFAVLVEDFFFGDEGFELLEEVVLDVGVGVFVDGDGGGGVGDEDDGEAFGYAGGADEGADARGDFDHLAAGLGGEGFGVDGHVDYPPCSSVELYGTSERSRRSNITIPTYGKLFARRRLNESIS